MKQLRNKSAAFLVFLTALCLVGLLLLPSGCSKKEDKREIKPEVKQETPVPQPVKTLSNFIHTSDIHFNPFYDPTLVAQLVTAPASGWNTIFQTSKIKDYSKVDVSDTNYPLFTAALQNMSRMLNKPDFIILTGDFLVHEFNDKFTANAPTGSDLDSFINKTFEFMSAMLKSTFPGTPVYFSLGNNDCYSGDYNLVADGKFLHNTAPILSANLLYDPANKASFNKTYPLGGYYIATPPGLPKARIIALNSIFFSEKRPAPAPGNAAYQELAWFETQLKDARQNQLKVWIEMHIPPGANVYSTIDKKTYSPMWYDEYNTKFIQLLETYAPEIIAGFAGHTHMDDWRLLMSTQTPTQAVSFLKIGPAISPLFGNNPGFQVDSYNPGSFTLTDYTVYWLNLEAPNPETQQFKLEYNFNSKYNQTTINPASVLSVYNAINSDPQTRSDYMIYYNVSDLKNPGMTDATWKYYWCGIGNWTKTGFDACAPK